MKSPTVNFDDFHVIYRQIHYDNRYFFVYFKNEYIMKLPFHIFKEIGVCIFPFYEKIKWDNNKYRHYIRFINRVYKYNKLLDNEI